MVTTDRDDERLTDDDIVRRDDARLEDRIEADKEKRAELDHKDKMEMVDKLRKMHKVDLVDVLAYVVEMPQGRTASYEEDMMRVVDSIYTLLPSDIMKKMRCKVCDAMPNPNKDPIQALREGYFIRTPNKIWWLCEGCREEVQGPAIQDACDNCEYPRECDR